MIGSILDDDAQFDHLILKSRFYISLLNWITQLFTLLIGILLRSPLLWSSDRYLMNLNDRLDRSFLYLFRCFPINLSLSLLSPRGLARDNNLSFHVQHVTIKFHLFFQIFIFFIWLYFDSLNWNLYWLKQRVIHTSADQNLQCQGVWPPLVRSNHTGSSFTFERQFVFFSRSTCHSQRYN